jgi:hypothetical protein
MTAAAAGEPAPEQPVARQEPPEKPEAEAPAADFAQMPDTGFADEIRAGRGGVRASGVIGGAHFDHAIVFALGDVVGRDKSVIGHAQAGHPLPRLLPRNIQEIYQTHVWPDCATTVRERLALSPVVVLTGPPGCGKAALAVNLLAEACTEIYELDRVPDLVTAPDEYFREACGYLLADLPQRLLLNLAHSELPRLVELVADRKAKLVLTVEPSFSYVPPPLREFVVPLTEPPAAADVLMAHLSHHLGAENATAVATVPEVRAQVEGAVGVSLTAGEVTALAIELAGRPEMLVDADMAWRLAEQRRTEVARWLAEVPDPCWPFLLSLAVLDGLSHDTVLTAARTFRTLAEADPLTKIEPLSANQRATLLETTRAEIRPDIQQSKYGLVPVDLVRFRRPGIAQWVLDYIWRHAHQLREPIIQWLADMAGVPGRQVQRQVAAAAGQLMTQDFPILDAHVLAPWAASGQVRDREAALVAMAVASEQPELRLVMVRMALSWMKGDYWSKWMAARSFGEPLGHFVPDGTLAVLGELAKDEELYPYAVSQALTEFADGATDDRFELALSAVDAWTTGANARRRHVGIYTFLRMCASIKDAGNRLPRLLTRPASHGDDPALAIWRRAITDEQLYTAARDALLGWARRCEAIESGPDRLARMLARIATTSRLTFLIRSAANTWRTHKYPLPRSAGAVLAAIPERKGEYP